MKFEKLFLVSLGIAFSLPVSLQAAAKEQSLEAIWNTVKTINVDVKSKTAQQIKAEQQLVAAVNQKLQKEEATKQKVVSASKTKAQPKIKKQAILSKSEDPKLARQRALWKAKWDAEQLAKKQTKVATNKPAIKTQVISKATVQTPVLKKSIQTGTARKVVKQQASKPLTREQYQWRWKQEQLKKQQQIQGNETIPLLTNADVHRIAKKHSQHKSKQAIFRPNRQAAALNSLPFAVKHKLSAAKLKTQGMSAYVQDVNSSRPLLGHQETASRVPASVMKLITSYAALGTLGPNYRWPLDVYTKGAVKNGTLNGDLIVKGYGSPEFNQADLRKVLQGIKQKGIRNVNGRVVFDNSYFRVSQQGSFDGKSQSAYNAQPDALLYNERLSTFKVRSTGKRVNVSTTTPTHNLKIVNRMRPTRRGCRPRIKVSNRGVQTVVTFSGRFSRRCGTRSYSRVISRPAEMIYGAMQAMWKRDVGGKLNTKFAMGRAPTNARPLLRTHSRTLAQILPTIDKDSNNVMARQVLLTIGAKATGQGTQKSGANAIGAWLASRGLNFPELRIENGSGLSRHARISARHMGDLLVDAYRSPYRNILMQSLAVAGVDGTMKRRLKRTQVRGKGFFKTGTLRDVRSIAGYVKAVDGKTYVMAILHNDPRAKGRALAAHDKLIEWVYSGGRSQQVAMK